MNEQPQVGVFSERDDTEEPEVETIEVEIDKLIPPDPADLVLNGPPTDLHLFIAKLCHEVNRAYSNTIGEFTLATHWDNLEPDERESIVEGVLFIAQNPGVTPEEIHNAWMMNKHNHGWQYGPTKNLERKEHPQMIPYAQLHRTQQAKDELFLTVCNVFFGREV